MANSMQARWQWIENWLVRNAPEVLANDLNQGCSLEQLLELETETGVKLPQSFKDFYLIHDGQKDEDYFGLFYGVSLLPLSKILEEIRVWNEVIDEFSEGEMKETLDDFQTSFMPNKLKAKYASKKWLPFAIIYDNCYLGLDFDPEIEGIVGQVINFGREEEQKTVLASSFEKFIDWYIQQLELGNHLIYSEDGNKQFIPKEYKERFFRGYNYLLGPVAIRFISLADEAILKEKLEKL